MSGRRVVAGLLAMMLGAAMISILPSSPPASAAADPTASDSAVTVSGKGDFANLKVTVSQTKNLINQTVTVSWTGGTPTVPSSDFFNNYLQIMQCWGDDPAGPDRTQCQFGATTDSGACCNQVDRGVAGHQDPEEALTPPGTFGAVFVPFWAVGTPKPIGAATQNGNDFFDSYVTNEIPLARTLGDGTGEEFFEVETARQAAGLGCGDPVTTTGGVSKGRSCWLVIVPRGTKEVDGSIRDGTHGQNSQLVSSPLSQSNWDNRIVVPLEFQPVGQACPIGAPERPVIGHELVTDAVSSWQPALCAGGGALFNYTQLPDDVARSQMAGKLAVVTNPIPPDQLPADPLVYAPVGLSGLTIAFNIDHQPPAPAPGVAPTPDQLKNGVRFTSMKLTPRLVAKLLTQSYRQSVLTTDAPFPDYLKNNPDGLLTDPEFLNLNPQYKGFVNIAQTVPQPLTQIDGADVTSLLWSWIKADPDASAFLAGKADPSGMVINPNNKDLALPTAVFPRNDQSCDDEIFNDGTNRLPFQNCTLDAFPFANDMHDAGRSASRGDPLTRYFNPTAHPPASQKGSRDFPGHDALLAVVDAATASRYGLPTAQLLNAAGTYVAPTTESLLAGEAAMKPSAVAGVLTSNPGTSDPAAYPLVALSYAVTSPATLNAAAGKDYATFLRYAGGPGQQQGLDPGLLPPGMVPLPDPLKAQTIAAAATIEAQAGKTAATSQTPTNSPAPPPSTTSGPTQDLPGGSNTAAGTGSTTTNPGGGQSGTPRGVIAPLGGPPANTPSVPQQPVTRARRTPSLPTPAVGALLRVILIAGALAASSSPVMRVLSGGLPSRWRKGVTPTEQ
ncbi:MAG: hypothetical protein ACRDQU_13690 [Pseudonocardiaceae bacterium]